ncbi:GIY-YIG nuclease family protein [Verrucosispora sp. NA02020]|uniref:GIY-YIG nuclease family protein n=1 Tax=Verrucosispora sp. NA02020 TaxID=2742132 RepID=UPI0034CE2819
MCSLHFNELNDYFLSRYLLQRQGEKPCSESPSTSVVYYIGDPPTQHVKIGTTIDLTRRFSRLRINRPGIKLLAVEPGDHRLEARRHRQFEHLRVVKRGQGGEIEWFRKAPELMEFIGGRRFKHGDPWQHEAVLRPRETVLRKVQAAAGGSK